MKIIRRKNIFVNTERRLTFNERCSEDETTLCPQCGELMIDARNLGAMLDLSLREVFRLIEANRIHFYESAEKISFVCLPSLEKLFFDTKQMEEIVNTETPTAGRFFK